MKDTGTIIIAPDDPGGPTVQGRVIRVFNGDGFPARLGVPDWKGRSNATKAVEIAVRLDFIAVPEMG